jgi:hypothetical protein
LQRRSHSTNIEINQTGGVDHSFTDTTGRVGWTYRLSNALLIQSMPAFCGCTALIVVIDAERTINLVNLYSASKVKNVDTG